MERLVATVEEATNRWIDFFGAMEGGERTSFLDLLSRWRKHLENFCQTELSVDIEQLPTLCELETTCRCVAAGKASGLDRIPSELCRFCSWLYSLTLKTGVQGQEALAAAFCYQSGKGNKVRTNVPHSGPPSFHRALAK